MVEIFEVILCIIVISSVVSSKVCVKYIRIRSWYRYFVELRQKQETKESLDQFTHKHSEHWEYDAVIEHTYQDPYALDEYHDHMRRTYNKPSNSVTDDQLDQIVYRNSSRASA